MISSEISDWIRKYSSKHKIQKLIVGISGGIDSAVVSTLCCMTDLPTIVVSLPINQNSEQLKRAREPVS